MTLICYGLSYALAQRAIHIIIKCIEYATQRSANAVRDGIYIVILQYRPSRKLVDYFQVSGNMIPK